MSSIDSLSHGDQPHLDHLLKIRVLDSRASSKSYPKKVREESLRELARYRDEGLTLQKYPTKENRMTKNTRAREPQVFSGRGIVYAVIDDRESLRTGRASTVQVIADAIEQALDSGHETSDEIAQYLTTSAFQHVPDKRVRFNSVLKAGDAVGARMVSKLLNAYNELCETAESEEDPKQKALLKAEATGFAEAIQVVLSPFSTEDASDSRLVSWDEVDRLTAAFEKEQRAVRRERNGNPQ